MEQRGISWLDLEPKQQPQTLTTKRKHEISEQPSSKIHASNPAKAAQESSGSSPRECEQENNIQAEHL